MLYLRFLVFAENQMVMENIENLAVKEKKKKKKEKEKDLGNVQVQNRILEYL